MAVSHDVLRRKNDEAIHAYKEKSRKLLQTQELYDRVKRKSEIGKIQRAAFDAVDSNVMAATQCNSQNLDQNEGEAIADNLRNLPSLGSGQRFDAMSMNTSMPRASFGRFDKGNRWSRLDITPHCEF